jgi:hypothetical protein
MTERAVALDDLLETIGEDFTSKILSDFLCPLNADVESFLKTKAVEFNRKAAAKTYLVFSQDDSLLAYFTLSNRAVAGKIEPLSKRMQERVDRFALRYTPSDTQILPMILIAQLGKNFAAHGNLSGKRLI